ncbi:hypothetical protein TSAR_006414 [Trichomalopsis sarcophagae]|uniref:Uncharacterized protein n=1 Tax=Trichomalopsis sarcophagae TaxID=543379 RepID=A0A232EFR9_9HYME|nr:hypothetical protein TSAR_006414 [Trichomalopsis sarcophagae]
MHDLVQADCTVYLEDMLLLEKNAPEVFEQFVKGRFTVKKSMISSSFVGTDQALEQSTNRVSKSTAGIIGCTRKKEIVATWNLTYHELLTVTNFLKRVTHITNDDDELFVHHEFRNTDITTSELAIEKIIKC